MEPKLNNELFQNDWVSVSEFTVGHLISSGPAIIAPSKPLSLSGPPFTDMTLLFMTKSPFPKLVWGYICGTTPLTTHR